MKPTSSEDDNSGPESAPGEGAALTTYHVRRARAGNASSLTWVVARFTPLLRATAQYRLGTTLRALHDPEDLVQEVWLITLPRLAELGANAERQTPILLKYLSTTLRRRIRDLVEKHVTGKPRRAGPGPDREGLEHDPLAQIPAAVTTLIRKLARRELKDLVGEALEHLDERDREIIILRGIEQHPYAEIAALLKTEVSGLAVRYQRALDRLRRALPRSIYDELEE